MSDLDPAMLAAAEAERLRVIAEVSRVNSEALRRIAEDARVLRETQRETLEGLRQDAERLRHAAVSAMQDTTDSIATTLEQMRVVEELRRSRRNPPDQAPPENN